MSKKILLVEDEALIAMNEAQMLKKHGYEVVTAYTGEKAIEAVVSDPEISLILMDIDLGKGIDGTEVAEEILNKKDTPVVFLSSHTEPEVVEKTEKITSYGYVVKNSGEMVLLTSIKMALRLFDSYQLADDAFRYSMNGICVHRMLYDEAGEPFDCEYLKMNDAFAQHTGVPVQTFVGKTFWELYPGEQTRELINLYAEVVHSGKPIQHELYFAQMSGWFEFCAYPTRNDEFTVVVNNITKRKLAEEALRLSEEYLAATLRSIGDGVIACNRQGKIASLNGVAELLTGWTSAEAAGRPLEEVFQIINAHTRKPAEDPVARAMREGLVVGLANHTVLIARNGTEYQIADSCAPIRVDSGEVMGAVLVFRDVTEEYRTRENLRQSEMRLRQVIDLVPHFIFAKDMYGTFLLANKAVADVYGTTPKNLLGKSDYDFSRNTEEIDFFVECDQKVIENGIGLYNIEEPITDSEGSIRYLETTKIPFTTVDSETPAVLAVSKDITERKQAAEELEESRKRFDLAIEGTGAGLWDWDMKSDRVVYSKRWKRMLGYEDYEIENSFYGWKKLWHPDDAHQIERSIEDYLEGKNKNYEVIHRLLHKDGTWRWILTRGGVLRDSDGNPYRWVGTNIDITNDKKNEENLKMALKEKEFLMKELNHRLKNNLAMVSSLINLKDSEIENDLSDLKHRVDVIKLVHEKLHQHNDIEHIEVKEYFQELLESIFYSTSRCTVQIINTIEDVSIPTKTAIPLGLVVNEIATNAIKYGFTDNEKARFSVDMRKDSDSKHYFLTLSNTGNPFPEEIGLGNSETMGLQLISSLVDQLNGTIELQKKPHPVFTIRFSVGEK